MMVLSVFYLFDELEENECIGEPAKNAHPAHTSYMQSLK